jgi:serine/threonine-protein kinase
LKPSVCSRLLTRAALARRPAAGLILVGGPLLLLAASTTFSFADRSQQQLTRQSLISLRSSSKATLELWLNDLCQLVSRPLEQAPIAAAARELLQPQSSPSAAARQVLDSQLEFDRWRPVAGQGVLGWALMDAQSRVIASNLTNLVGQRLAIPADAIEHCLAQRVTVCRPFALPVAIDGAAVHYSIPGGPVMCALAPISDHARLIGVLAAIHDPLDQFTKLLSLSQLGETGQTYAFDRRGVLLSQSRFESQLRAAGLLDADPAVVSPLNIFIVDPGDDIMRRAGRLTIDDQRPATRMADQATRGSTGDDVHGYRDYRGVTVVGAWCWLPAYGIGIATEVEVAEAYRPLLGLRRALYGMLGLISMGVLGWLANEFYQRRAAGRWNSDSHRSRPEGPYAPGDQIGQYVLGDLIGQGGMGTVYRARHQFLPRDVAIKILDCDRDLNALTIARFEREVQLTAQLKHPATIDIYDYGRTESGGFFYVMEYIDGITLQQLVDQNGRQSPARVIHLLLQICGALAEAHQLGIIHRDIKPSNLLLHVRAGLYDMVNVLDFGLVKQLDSDTLAPETSTDLTHTDGITGTPMYMSPESVRDVSMADQRSDLYSVGAVGYFLLTGAPVFDGDCAVDICLQQLNQQPQRPAERIGQRLPEDLQNVLMSCLRKLPEERPQTADELADSLRHCQDANGWTTAAAMQWWEVGAGAE